MFLTKFLIAFGAFLVICANLIPARVEAQYLPPGTYKETCKNYMVFGGLLKAACQKRDGSWKDSTIQYNRCEGSIWNDNGNLTCKERQYNVPKGSYRESCKNYEVEGNKLKAWCKRRDGSYHSTSINYKNCKGDIWNDNGNLSCDQSQSGAPKGSYKETCRGYYVEGNWLYAQCKKRDGSWRNSNINYKNCKGDIWNDNGNLSCN